LDYFPGEDIRYTANWNDCIFQLSLSFRRHLGRIACVARNKAKTKDMELDFSFPSPLLIEWLTVEVKHDLWNIIFVLVVKLKSGTLSCNFSR